MAEPPRVRLAKDIDLSQADSDCKRCGGTGVLRHETVNLGDGEGEQTVPVICRCVSRNGGVRGDEWDRIQAEAEEMLEDGRFYQRMAEDILRTNHKRRPGAVAGIMVRRVDPESSDETKDAMDKVLTSLSSRKGWGRLRSRALRILMRRAAAEQDEDRRGVIQEAMAAAKADMH